MLKNKDNNWKFESYKVSISAKRRRKKSEANNNASHINLNKQWVTEYANCFLKTHRMLMISWFVLLFQNPLK